MLEHIKHIMIQDVQLKKQEHIPKDKEGDEWTDFFSENPTTAKDMTKKS